MAKEKSIKKRKKKKKKIRKLHVSAAAFILAAVIIVFCIYYVYFETPYFYITAVDVVGNTTYNKDYILDKAQIEIGAKIFSVDRDKVKTAIEEEVYIEKARVVYGLPNRILIEVLERTEKYQVFFNNEYIVTNENGVVLKTSSEKNELITIESLADVLYNVGESIQFAGVENTKIIFQTVDYINDEFGSDSVKSLSIDLNNSLLLETEYGTSIRIKLYEDIKYQIVFAMKIINERLNNNLSVTNGLIDFTKGDSPVYIEDFK